MSGQPRPYLYWFTLERFCIFASLFYGSFVWAFRSLGLNQNLAPLSRAVSDLPGPPEAIIAGILYLSAVLQLVGLARRSTALRMYAPLCGCLVFGSILASILAVTPTGTGVPAYVIIAGLYVMLALRRATGTEWIPLR